MKKKIVTTCLSIIAAIIVFQPVGTVFAAKSIYSKEVTYTHHYNTASFTVKKGKKFQISTHCVNKEAKSHKQYMYAQRYQGNKWVTVRSWEQRCAPMFAPQNITIKSKGGWYRVKLVNPKPSKTWASVKVTG